MGGFNSTVDNVVQEIPNPNNQNSQAALWSAPAFWNNTLYTWGQWRAELAGVLVVERQTVSFSDFHRVAASSAYPRRDSLRFLQWKQQRNRVGGTDGWLQRTNTGNSPCL